MNIMIMIKVIATAATLCFVTEPFKRNMIFMTIDIWHYDSSSDSNDDDSNHLHFVLWNIYHAKDDEEIVDLNVTYEIQVSRIFTKNFKTKVYWNSYLTHLRIWKYEKNIVTHI